jgi:hypothetical protein
MPGRTLAPVVIGPRFIWAHLPKTGGTLTARLLQLFPELITEVDWHGSPGKHRPFATVEELFPGRVLAMNFRRLPNWVVSFYQHRARYGVHPERTPIPIDPPDELARTQIPQSLIRHFTDEGRIVPDRWIRQEHLVEDTLAFAGEFARVTWRHRRKARRLGLVNAMDYDHDLSRWLGPGHIRTLYESNPLWAELEEQVYGGVEAG